jgi:hypothetical protein
MANAINASLSADVEPNCLASIEQRFKNGLIPWKGPLLLVAARSFLLVAAQGLMALALLALHKPSPWQAAGEWWNVYGTLVDLCCVAGMIYFTRREGIRLRDLLGPVRLRWGHDIFLGLGYLLLTFPFFMGGSYVGRLMLYNSPQHDLGSAMAHVHTLPVWAVVYSLSVWWVIWSPVEEATYQAYAMPRLRALTGRTWIAFAITAFFWTAQHLALPWIPDWRLQTFRFLMFLPGIVVLMLLYMRTKRLAPLIVAHWPMDILASLMAAFQ